MFLFKYIFYIVFRFIQYTSKCGDEDIALEYTFKFYALWLLLFLNSLSLFITYYLWGVEIMSLYRLVFFFGLLILILLGWIYLQFFQEKRVLAYLHRTHAKFETLSSFTRRLICWSTFVLFLIGLSGIWLLKMYLEYYP